MRVTVYLTEEQFALLEQQADLEYRKPNKQAQVLIIEGLERDTRLKKLEPAAA